MSQPPRIRLAGASGGPVRPPTPPRVLILAGRHADGDVKVLLAHALDARARRITSPVLLDAERVLPPADRRGDPTDVARRALASIGSAPETVRPLIAVPQARVVIADGMPAAKPNGTTDWLSLNRAITAVREHGDGADAMTLLTLLLAAHKPGPLGTDGATWDPLPPPRRRDGWQARQVALIPFRIEHGVPEVLLCRRIGTGGDGFVAVGGSVPARPDGLLEAAGSALATLGLAEGQLTELAAFAGDDAFLLLAEGAARADNGAPAVGEWVTLERALRSVVATLPYAEAWTLLSLLLIAQRVGVRPARS
jgi:hypothetical protein